MFWGPVLDMLGALGGYLRRLFRRCLKHVRREKNLRYSMKAMEKESFLNTSGLNN